MESRPFIESVSAGGFEIGHAEMAPSKTRFISAKVFDFMLQDQVVVFALSEIPGFVSHEIFTSACTDFEIVSLSAKAERDQGEAGRSLGEVFCENLGAVGIIYLDRIVAIDAVIPSDQSNFPAAMDELVLL